MTSYYEEAGITIYRGDCRDILPLLVPGDHVVTDPPYDEHTHANVRSGGSGDQLRGINHAIGLQFAAVNDDLWFLPLCLSARRWIVCFAALEQLAFYKAASGSAWVRAGFWRKPDGAPQFTGDRPAQPGDGVAIMHRAGRKRWNGGGSHAYWEHIVERVNRQHPTQKPEPLMVDLVQAFTDPGDLVLDPFMGSGTTLVACKRLARRAIGIELNERYCEIAANRLRQAVLPLAVAPEATQADLLGGDAA